MGVDAIPVTFNYTDAKGQKGKQILYVQPGINFDFGGKTYKVGKNGVTAEGDVIKEISVSRDKLDTLMGMSQMDNTDNLQKDKKAFVLSERDVDQFFHESFENGQGSDFKVNQRLQLHGSKARYDWDNHMYDTGEAYVDIKNGENKTKVTISSEKSRSIAAQKNRLDAAYAQKHYIRNFFGITREDYEKDHKRDY